MCKEKLRNFTQTGINCDPHIERTHTANSTKSNKANQPFFRCCPEIMLSQPSLHVGLSSMLADVYTDSTSVCISLTFLTLAPRAGEIVAIH